MFKRVLALLGVVWVNKVLIDWLNWLIDWLFNVFRNRLLILNSSRSAIQRCSEHENCNAHEILMHMMESIVLFWHANWKLNMKCRELIKPDLNRPYTSLCKEEIKPSTKLFGHDLSKHFKVMSVVKHAGQQMLKATSGSAYTNKASSSKATRSKPYDWPSNRLNTCHDY